MTRRPPVAVAVRWLRPVLREQRRPVAALVLWSVVAAVPVLVSGRLIALALDEGFLAGESWTGVLALAAYALAMAVGAVGTRQVVTPVGRVVEVVRDHVFTVTVHAGLARAVAQDQADARPVSRLITQAERVRQVLAGLLLTVGSVGTSMVAALVGLATLAPVVAAVVLPILVVGGLALRWITRTWWHRYDATLAADEDLAHEISRSIDGLRDVVACGARGRTTADLRARSLTCAARQVDVGAVSGIRVGVLAIAARVPLVLLLALAPWLLAGDTLTTGELVGAAWYLASGLEPAVRTLVETVATMGLELVAVLGRLAQATDPAREVPQEGAAALPVRYDIDLSAVTFRYGPHSAPVLDRLRLELTAGEHLAVVGPSGIGKSTLASVIVGLTQPQHGEVRLGGVPLADLRPADLRRDVLLVPQEGYVFVGSMRDNLAYHVPAAADHVLTAAADAVGARHLVERLGGLGAGIEPGALSQGERQLIGLARAYASPARTVVLDEATCHLDAAAETHAESAFADRAGTLVVIAHRISSALRADRTLVMDGRSVQVSTCRELLDTSATFADMVGYWRSGETGP